MQEFRTTLGDFVTRLRVALPEPVVTPPSPVPAAPLDPAQSRPVIEEMIGLLNNFDPASEQRLETHRAIFQAVMSTEAFTSFEQHVSGFSFDQALAQLQPAAKA